MEQDKKLNIVYKQFVSFTTSYFTYHPSLKFMTFSSFTFFIRKFGTCHQKILSQDTEKGHFIKKVTQKVFG